VIQRYFDDSAIREHSLHLVRELLPGPAPPKIVDHQEAAGQQVIPERQHFLFGKRHRTHFYRVQQWKAPQSRIGQFNRVVRFVSVDDAQALEGYQELVVRLGIVDRPAPALVVIVELAARYKCPG
jgi:hypothetical protein